MKFEFTITNKVDTAAWRISNSKLEQDLNELTTGKVSEEEVTSYLMDMIQTLKPVDNNQHNDMLFLMYDAPSSMPADARVEYVYKPTYLAATILMTAMNRYNSIAANTAVRKTTHGVLEATMGRNFVGAGYDEYIGLLETLRIFAQGDTMEFIKKFPQINERFVSKLEEALTFLETEICTGKIKDVWSSEDYSDKGKKILAMYQNTIIPESTHVWYACYGSNLSKERFMKYIRCCTDKTPPSEDRPFLFRHPIYFAKSASNWQNGGKAFLDDSSVGMTYGRAYKITRDQYEEIKQFEGADYTKNLSLGEIDGIPVYSFTDTQKNAPQKTPSSKYFSTILTGLRECYGEEFANVILENQLVAKVFPGYTFAVVRAVKENTHHISNAEISFATGLELSEVIIATTWLVKHNVIQQDRRSINAGHLINDPQAFFFTVDSPNARDLVVTMLDSMPRENQEVVTNSFEAEAEGNRSFVFASRIERSSRNRLEAIRLHGCKCQVCGFDFGQVYGDVGKNYIEVHHITPLAKQGGEQVVNPETDLVCLCANCHRMIHRNRHRPLSVDALRKIVNNR